MTSLSVVGSGLRPAIASGSTMLSAAESVGTRLYAWKMKPTLSRRSDLSCFSLRVPSSVSPMMILPDVTESSPARQCSRVDLPDPDGPMIAVNWLRLKSTLIPFKAVTAASPLPYTLTASTARATTSGATGLAEGGVDAASGGGVVTASVLSGTQIPSWCSSRRGRYLSNAAADRRRPLHCQGFGFRIGTLRPWVHRGARTLWRREPSRSL